MPRPAVEEFAKILVEFVRDLAIESTEVLLQPNAKGPTARRWRSTAAVGDWHKLARVIMVDAVDSALFYLLHAIDSGALQISFKTAQGSTVDLVEEGESEMAGWYMGTESWPEKFSKQRVFNDEP